MSGFGNIFTVGRRYAENADARFDIRRQDPDQERKRKNEGEAENKTGFDTYDNAVVSVDALRAFLENFLKSLYGPENEKNISVTLDAAPMDAAPALEKPVSAQASRAAGAYQTTARAVNPAPVKPAPEKNYDDKLASDDVRAIHRLLSEISILQARRIEFLTIERGETFLASLAAAIEKAKNL